MKKKSRNKKRRTVYPYRCKTCGKKRIAFVYDRAKAEQCHTCEVQNFHNEHQMTLLDAPTVT